MGLFNALRRLWMLMFRCGQPRRLLCIADVSVLVLQRLQTCKPCLLWPTPHESRISALV